MSGPKQTITYEGYIRRFEEFATYIGLSSQFINRGKNRYETGRFSDEGKDQFHPVWFHFRVHNDFMPMMWWRFCELYYDETTNDLRQEVIIYGLKLTTFLEQMGWTHKRARQLAKCYHPTSTAQYLIIAIHEIRGCSEEMRYLMDHPEARDATDLPIRTFPYYPMTTMNEFRRCHNRLFNDYLIGRDYQDDPDTEYMLAHT